MSRYSFLGALTSGMNAVGTILVVFIMVVILTDVIGGVFRDPLSGTGNRRDVDRRDRLPAVPATLRAGRVIVDGFMECVGKRSVRAEQYCLAGFHLLGGICS